MHRRCYLLHYALVVVVIVLDCNVAEIQTEEDTPDEVNDSIYSSSSQLSADPDEDSFVEPSGTYSPMFFKYNEYLTKKLQIVVANDNVKLFCPVKGNPTPTVTWTRADGQPLVSERMVVNEETNILKIKNAKTNDAGEYTCTASNHLDTIQHTYTVKVIERVKVRPSITQLLPGNQTVTVGSTVSFQCEVFSDTTPHFVWMKWINPSKPISLKEERNRIKFLEKDDGNSLSNELKLLNVTFEDAGKYTCVVGNYLGITHKNVWLSVVPETPPSLTDQPSVIPIPQHAQTNISNFKRIVLVIGICMLLVIFILIICLVVQCRNNTENINQSKKVPYLTN